MDIAQTMTAINEFQNALDKNRALLTMMRAAETLWTQLGTIREDELNAIAKSGDQLKAQIGQLSQQRDQLQSSVDALAVTLKDRTAAMDKQLQQRKDAADAEHAAVVAKMRDEIASLQTEHNSLAQFHQQFVEQATTQRKNLQQQIQQLKSQATAIAHA